MAAIDHILFTTLAQLDFLSSPAIGILSPGEIGHIQSKLRASFSPASNINSIPLHAPSPRQNQTIPIDAGFNQMSMNDTGSNASSAPYNHQTQSQPQPQQQYNNNSIPGLPPRNMPPPPIQISGQTGEAEKRAVALWDYAGDQADDLRLNKGDVVVVTEELNPQWLKGHLLTQPSISGLFPANYVERLPPSTSPSLAPSNGPQSQALALSQSQTPAGYPNEKAAQLYHPPGPSQSGYELPPPPQHQGYYTSQGGAQGQGQMQSYQPGQMMQPPPQQIQQAGDPAKKTKLFNGDFKSTLAHSAVGGFGFGAGSSVAGHIVNAIL